MTKQLTKEQITKLTNDPDIKQTVAANIAAQKARREAALMLLGYNQALLENENWPEGHTYQSWADVIKAQKAKLGK